MLDYPLADVIDLINEHLDNSRRTKRTQPQQNINNTPAMNGPKVIHRQADDSWF